MKFVTISLFSFGVERGKCLVTWSYEDSFSILDEYGLISIFLHLLMLIQ